ncbi:MAG: hypothetical protein QXI33_02795 [Candidatus Pacearchaeota archaeon]
MKPERLSNAEIEIVDNPEDIPYLEIIKGMTLEEMKFFDCYSPKYIDHYNRKQNEWIKSEKHLIRNRPGHGEDVSPEELLEDMKHNHNALRFKVWYVFKYPGLVKRIKE